jgi:hypothetical protein
MNGLAEGADQTANDNAASDSSDLAGQAEPTPTR